MRYTICLIADNHFVLGLDGNYYVNGTYTENYLRRFTSNFDKAIVIARGHKAISEDEISRLRLSGGERVSFCLLPDFYGIKEYLHNKTLIREQILEIFSSSDAVFVRMPCILTTIAVKCAKKLNKPIMVDVGADPETIYLSSPPTLFEVFLSKYMRKMCSTICQKANGVSYVTNHVLQKKYPCKALTKGETIEYFTESISNADITDNCYKLRAYKALDGKVKLLHISNNICCNSGKGHEEAILVLAELQNKGIDASLTFVGDGDGINALRKIAMNHGVANKIFFTGRIADRKEYFDIINNHDIFIFPSHSEGLPRVLLEVMATGMVCVSSNVNGIPELLAEKDIFAFSNYTGMANRIEEYVSNLQLLSQTSENNYAVSLKYSCRALQRKYDCYYSKVRKLIEYRLCK